MARWRSRRLPAANGIGRRRPTSSARGRCWRRRAWGSVSSSSSVTKRPTSPSGWPTTTPSGCSTSSSTTTAAPTSCTRSSNRGSTTASSRWCTGRFRAVRSTPTPTPCASMARRSTGWPTSTLTSSWCHWWMMISPRCWRAGPTRPTCASRAWTLVSPGIARHRTSWSSRLTPRWPTYSAVTPPRHRVSRRWCSHAASPRSASTPPPWPMRRSLPTDSRCRPRRWARPAGTTPS